MTFGVMITTHNRCNDLQRTLHHLSRLSPQPSEIWICADGSKDDSVAMVRAECPTANLIINEVCQGSVPSRDQMLRNMSADWILSLDDDSYPLDLDFFSRIPPLVEAHPDVSVFTFPEQRDGCTYPDQKRTPDTLGHCVSAYPNCAAIMSRADYLKTDGYPTFFTHNYEESDYALQLFNINRSVWFEPSLIIRHHLSPTNRNRLHNHHLNARNELWSVWMRCPWPWLPLVSGFRILRQFQYACSQGLTWAMREPLWWLTALNGLHHCLRNRRPVPWARYFSWMKHAREGPIPTHLTSSRLPS